MLFDACMRIKNQVAYYYYFAHIHEPWAVFDILFAAPNIFVPVEWHSYHIGRSCVNIREHSIL